MAKKQKKVSLREIEEDFLLFAVFGLNLNTIPISKLPIFELSLSGLDPPHLFRIPDDDIIGWSHQLKKKKKICFDRYQ